MNIAIFTNNYLPNPYGVTVSIESFRKELERQGHTVYIFAQAARGYKDENPNVFRYPSIDIRYKIKFPLAIPISPRIDRILESLNIDIIHAQHPNLLGLAAKKWAKKKGVPLVFTWHTRYDQYVHYVPLIPKKLALWWAVRNAVDYVNQADAVVVPTNSVRPLIEGWGVINKNIQAIPTGIADAYMIDGDGEAARKKYSIPLDAPLLVLITRLTLEKNVEFLLRACIAVLKKNEKVHFIIGGDGDQKKNIEALIRKHNLEPRIHVIGYANESTERDCYTAADMFVFASKSETQGMIIAEAMRFGLPIVAVRATGVVDQVVDGETGILVGENEGEFANAVEKLIENPELRRQMGEKGRARAEKEFTSRICTSKMLELYSKVIDNNKKA